MKSSSTGFSFGSEAGGRTSDGSLGSAQLQPQVAGGLSGGFGNVSTGQTGGLFGNTSDGTTSLGGTSLFRGSSTMTNAGAGGLLGSTAPSAGTTAFGRGANGFGTGTTGFGTGTTAFGTGTTGFGTGTTAFGRGANGFGTGTTGFGTGTTAFGRGTTGFGTGTTAFGRGTTGFGTDTAGFGTGTTAFGRGTTGFGTDTTGFGTGTTGFRTGTTGFGTCSPGFGTGTTCFATGTTGFGTGTTGFGTGTTGFGTGTTGFGTSTTGFGTGTTGFGTSTTGFGAGTTGFRTGTNCFGTGTTGFGTGTTGFGTGTIGFGADTTGFGSSLISDQQSTSTFGLGKGSSNSAAKIIFGNNDQAIETMVKFNPPKGQDTMLKSGTSHTINTRHQCITAMKEYEAKSLEELRFEYYGVSGKCRIWSSSQEQHHSVSALQDSFDKLGFRGLLEHAEDCVDADIAKRRRGSESDVDSKRTKPAWPIHGLSAIPSFAHGATSANTGRFQHFTPTSRASFASLGKCPYFKSALEQVEHEAYLRDRDVTRCPAGTPTMQRKETVVQTDGSSYVLTTTYVPETVLRRQRSIGVQWGDGVL